MSANTAWTVVEPDLDAALGGFDFPLDELAAGSIPAMVLRVVFPAAAWSALVDRLARISQRFRITALS